MVVFPVVENDAWHNLDGGICIANFLHPLEVNIVSAFNSSRLIIIIQFDLQPHGTDVGEFAGEDLGHIVATVVPLEG